MPSYKITKLKWKQYELENRYPIVLQVIHDRKRRLHYLDYFVTDDEWNDELCRFTPKHKNHKLKNHSLEMLDAKIDRLFAEFKNESIAFSFELFFERLNERKKTISVFELYYILIDELLQKQKINTSIIYKSSLGVVRRFRKNKDFSFHEVNYEFLKSFESYLFSRNNTGGGVHHHMRTFRAVVNEAIKRKYLDKAYYPFSNSTSREGYSLSHLKSKALPRALSQSDLDLLKGFDVSKYPELGDSYRYFMFSYYAHGINFGDMAMLKRENLYGDRIWYFRSKTGNPLNLQFSDVLQGIVKEFNNDESEYIFPILNTFHVTEVQKRRRIHKKLKKVNSDLKIIANILGFNFVLTTYVARHTYATRLKFKGIDPGLIGDCLGQSDHKSVKAYLDKFSNEELDKTDALL